MRRHALQAVGSDNFIRAAKRQVDLHTIRVVGTRISVVEPQPFVLEEDE